MTNPTRQEIIDAHQVVKDYIEHELDVAYTEADTEEALRRERLLLKFLPPKPRPTMDEVEWDTDKHFLAEAEHKDGSDTIMLWKTESGCIGIIRNGLVCAVYPDTLTPTGRRYILQEGE